MTDNVKLLEDLVSRAADRLHSLSTQRGELREEVVQLNERLEVLGRDASKRDRGDDAEATWQAKRQEAVSFLNRTLSELRSD